MTPRNNHYFIPIFLGSLLAVSLACSFFNDLTSSKDIVEDVISNIDPEIDAASDLPESVNPPEVESSEKDEQTVPDQDVETGVIEGSEHFDTVFPLPDDVQNFDGRGGESQINFQTNLSLDESITFYRQAFAEENLYEREAATVISETVFSMIFDGHGNGKPLVIQGVDLGDGLTNINIRFEDT
jgi:hypothetical protein